MPDMPGKNNQIKGDTMKKAIDIINQEIRFHIEKPTPEGKCSGFRDGFMEGLFHLSKLFTELDKIHNESTEVE